MLAFILTFAFLFGTIIGSFINVLVYRLRNDMELWDRSRCVNCDRVLKPHHLVPVISWVFLGGRCAFCHKRISIQYPLVEFVAGLLSLGQALMVIVHGGCSPLVYGFELLFIFVLFTLALFDWRWQLLPVELMLAATVVLGAGAYYIVGLSVVSIVIGLLVGVGLLGLPFLLSRGRWMGGGDPLFAGMMGAALGWPRMGVALYFTCLWSGVVVLVWWLGRYFFPKKRPTLRFAFAPVLALGALTALWIGPWIEPWIASVLSVRVW